jgi:hypothetical protein
MINEIRALVCPFANGFIELGRWARFIDVSVYAE